MAETTAETIVARAADSTGVIVATIVLATSAVASGTGIAPDHGAVGGTTHPHAPIEAVGAGSVAIRDQSVGQSVAVGTAIGGGTIPAKAAVTVTDSAVSMGIRQGDPTTDARPVEVSAGLRRGIATRAVPGSDAGAAPVATIAVRQSAAQAMGPDAAMTTVGAMAADSIAVPTGEATKVFSAGTAIDPIGTIGVDRMVSARAGMAIGGTIGGGIGTDSRRGRGATVNDVTVTDVTVTDVTVAGATVIAVTASSGRSMAARRRRAGTTGVPVVNPMTGRVCRDT